MTLVLATTFGVAIGLLLGLVGGGGSILAVPVLIYLLDEPVKDATTASLLIVAVSAGVAAVSHGRRGRVDTRMAGAFVVMSAAGSIVGTALNRGSRPTAIVVVLAAVMLIAAAAMLRAPAPQPAARTPAGPSPIVWGRLAPAALAVGVLTGYVGVGGGFLIVPVLTMLLGLELSRAIGTSLVIIAVTSTVGLVAHLGTGAINWGIAIPFTAAAVIGSLVGTHLSGRTSRERLTRLFAGLVIAVALALLTSTAVGIG